jgi:hypothetical protein
MDDVLDKLGQSKLFSTLDLASGIGSEDAPWLSRAIFLMNQHHWAGPRTRGRLYHHSLGLHLPKLSANFGTDGKWCATNRLSAEWGITSVNGHLYQISLTSVPFVDSKGLMMAE